MRSFALAATAGALAALSSLSLSDAAPAACRDPVAACDAAADYFPDKAAFRHANASSVPSVAYARTHVDVTVASANLGREFAYRFVRCGCEDVAGDAGEGVVVVPVPVAGVFAGDSVVMAMLEDADALDAGESLKAVGSAAFVYSEAVRGAVERGEVAEVVDAAGLVGREEELGVGVGVVNYFGTEPWEAAFGAPAAGGVPMVVSCESGEADPLGRAEWIKVMGILVGKEARAAEVFDGIEARYGAVRDRAFSVRRRPSVVLNSPTDFGAVSWGQPGGDTYAAALLRDANADYRYAGDGEAKTVSRTVDEVVRDFGSARVWLGLGRFPAVPAETVATLVAPGQDTDAGGFSDDMVAGFKEMAALKCGRAWSISKDVTADGGANNYFEQGVLRPDLVLEDLLEIFHPDVSDKGEGDLKFYYKVAGDGDDVDGVAECPYNALPNDAPAGKTFHVTELQVAGTDRFAMEDELAKGALEPAIAAAAGVPAEDVEVFFDRPADGAGGDAFAKVRALADDDADYDHDAVADAVRGGLNADAVTVVSTDQSDTVAANDEDKDGDGGGVNVGAIVGASLGSLALLALAVVAACCCLRKSRQQPDAVDVKESFVPEAESYAPAAGGADNI